MGVAWERSPAGIGKDFIGKAFWKTKVGFVMLIPAEAMLVLLLKAGPGLFGLMNGLS